jgi:hypothetical protein
MFTAFTDELFQGFVKICNTSTGIWYGQEEFGYPALLSLSECCSISFCAADISQKVISLQLKGYTLTDFTVPCGSDFQYSVRYVVNFAI